MYVFLFYLFSILLLGGYLIGPFSIRVYMTIFMLAFLAIRYDISKKNNPYRIPAKFVFLYIVFVIMAALALMMSGNYEYFGFTKLVFANYLNCIVSFFAIDYFVKGEKELKTVLVFLSVIIGIDAIVTLLQHFGNPIGQAIAFAMTTSAEFQSNTIDSNDAVYGVLFGESLPIGIFGYVHTNATYLATFGLVPFCLILMEKRKSFLFLYLLLLAISFYACLCTQERAAFLLFVLVLVALISVSKIKQRTKTTFWFILILFVLFALPILLSEGTLGRLSNFDSGGDSRNSIWVDAFNFIPNHILWGGPHEFYIINDKGGHNIILNGLINFGLIGSFVAFWLYFSMIFQSLRFSLQKGRIILQVLAGTVLIYSGICLFHNASILTGDTLIFILYPLMLKSSLINRDSLKAGIQNHLYTTRTNN